MPVLALVIGRWWLIPLAAVGWAVMPAATGVVTWAAAPGTFGIGAANAAARGLVHRALMGAARLLSNAHRGRGTS